MHTYRNGGSMYTNRNICIYANIGIQIAMYVYISMYTYAMYVYIAMCMYIYGVAMISRFLKNIGFFCKRAL